MLSFSNSPDDRFFILKILTENIVYELTHQIELQLTHTYIYLMGMEMHWILMGILFLQTVLMHIYHDNKGEKNA
jgi:hypothetical protein